MGSSGSGKTTLLRLILGLYKDIQGNILANTENLKKGDTLLLPESSDTMDLLKTESIKGVYNVNKGYAVFKQVQILSESDEYYIIAEGNSYSLSNYDHIALNGDSVRDNQIVSQ